MKNPGAYTRLFKADHDSAAMAGGLPGLAVFVALCRIHSDAPPQEKHSFRAGASRIAHHACVSTRTVKRMLPILANEGLIQILSGRRKDRAGADYEENRITLLGSVAIAQGRDTESLGGSDSQTLGSDCETFRDGPLLKKDKPKGLSKRNSRFAGRGQEAPAASGIGKKNPHVASFGDE